VSENTEGPGHSRVTTQVRPVLRQGVPTGSKAQGFPCGGSWPGHAAHRGTKLTWAIVRNRAFLCAGSLSRRWQAGQFALAIFFG
jgi:hypothetical protein